MQKSCSSLGFVGCHVTNAVDSLRDQSVQTNLNFGISSILSRNTIETNWPQIEAHAGCNLLPPILRTFSDDRSETGAMDKLIYSADCCHFDTLRVKTLGGCKLGSKWLASARVRTVWLRTWRYSFSTGGDNINFSLSFPVRAIVGACSCAEMLMCAEVSYRQRSTRHYSLTAHQCHYSTPQHSM
jgi:hypothetical protein